MMKLSPIPSFVLLGTGGNFTSTVLRELLDNGCKPKAYFQSGATHVRSNESFAGIAVESRASLPTAETLCQQHQITCQCNVLDRLEFVLEQTSPDFLLCACWPRLISKAAITLIGKAALNLHPSLLPAFRGADPIRDQLRAGLTEYGISLHLIDEYFDHGDIVSQRLFTSSKGNDYREIESEAARLGADLFIRAIERFAAYGWDLKPQEHQ